jgi:hypothetical protein
MLCSKYVSEVASLFPSYSIRERLFVWAVALVNREKLVISVLIRDRVYNPNIDTNMLKLCSAANNFAPQTIGPIAAAKRRGAVCPSMEFMSGLLSPHRPGEAGTALCNAD